MKRNYIYPINNMADATSTFAFTTAEEREASLERLEKLNIRSGDEIENLYRAVTRMAEDSSEYISEVKRKSEVITKMQDDIIVDFAEMVEARDKCTGDHIKKTSYYVGVIAREMKREGMYADKMTDDYIDRLEHSAPLHDVGKIKISDTILNKPGKLTDEEFDIMKTHTTEGKAVLTKTTSLAESDGYIKEAIEMAAYHHERWDGRGYPEGLKGEEIPLSARIMAVADVFDALVSKRSYKEPFSFDKAVSIITEESGTHFDPSVVKAFLNIAQDAYNGTAV
jgi:response regulator RpfG family c-di-GMP phosphodiesterase